MEEIIAKPTGRAARRAGVGSARGSAIAAPRPIRIGAISSRWPTPEATDMDASLRWHDGLGVEQDPLVC